MNKFIFFYFMIFTASSYSSNVECLDSLEQAVHLSQNIITSKAPKRRLALHNTDIEQDQVNLTKIANIQDLPNELIFKILSWIQPADLVKINRVCHNFYGLIRSMTKTHMFNLSETQCSHDKLEQIARQDVYTSFDLSLCKLNATQAKVLSLSYLENINLSHNPLGDEGVASICGIKTVKKLYLSNTCVTHKVMPALFTMSSLKKLVLNCNDLTDEALVDFSKTNKSIINISLSHNFLTDQSAYSLAQDSLLQKVNVYSNSIGYAGARALIKSTIHYIELSENKLTDSEKNTLKNLSIENKFQRKVDL